MNDLTPRLAFDAMRMFLEGYFERTHSDDVGALLGDLRALPDGNPIDPAAWADWQACVRRVLAKR
jgi:hypothetical protein